MKVFGNDLQSKGRGSALSVVRVSAAGSNVVAMGSIEKENQEGRARATNGTMSYMPAIFGQTISGIVIKDLVGDDFNN